MTKMGYFGVGPAVPARSAAELPALSGNHLLTAALAVLHLGQCLALPGMAKLIPSPTSNFTFVPPADFTVVKLLWLICVHLSQANLHRKAELGSGQVKALGAGGSKLLGPNFHSLGGLWQCAERSVPQFPSLKNRMIPISRVG